MCKTSRCSSARKPVQLALELLRGVLGRNREDQVTTGRVPGGSLETMLKQLGSLAAAALGFTALIGLWLAYRPPVVEPGPAEEPGVQQAARVGDLTTLDEPQGVTVSRAGLEADTSAFVLVAVRNVLGEAVPNIPVAPSCLLSDGRTKFMGGPVQTGPDGIARVPLRWGLWEQHEGPIYVELLGIFKTPVRRKVSQNGVGRVELCAPEMGEVIVSTPGTRGAENERRPTRAVELWQGDRPMGNLYAPMWGAHRPIRQGPSHFFHIETGQHLTAGILRGGRVECAISFRGPSAEGEIVRVSLERDGPGLTGRLVDESGKPLTQVAVTVRQSRRWSSPALVEYTTDADGVLQWTEFRPRIFRGVVKDDLVLMVQQQSPREAPYVPLFVAAPNGWPGIPTELGTLTVERLERIAGGVVLNEGGSPIAGARVSLERRLATGSSWDGVSVKGIRSLTAESDASGAFTLFACPEPGDYRLVVRAEGYLQGERELPSPGMEELELVLRTSASLVGEVLVDPDLEPSMFKVKVTHSSGVPYLGGDVDKHGRFRVDGIPPGSVEPKIVLNNGQTVAVLARTELSAGQEMDLGTTDVRGQVFTRVVRIFGERKRRAIQSRAPTKSNEGGAPTNFPNNPGIGAWAREREGRFGWLVVGKVDPGPALLTIRTVTESVEVKIMVVGFRDTDWLTITGDQDVTLVAEGE